MNAITPPQPSLDAANLTITPARNELTDYLLELHRQGPVSPYVIMSVGIPGSGKSEVMQQMAYQLGIEVVQPASMQNFAQDPQTAWRTAHSLIREILLKRGEPVIVEGTHINSRRFNRAAAVESYKRKGAAAVMAVMLHIEAHRAIQNLSLRSPDSTYVPRGGTTRGIRDAQISLQRSPVSYSEGFDLIAERKIGEEEIRIVS